MFQGSGKSFCGHLRRTGRADDIGRVQVFADTDVTWSSRLLSRLGQAVKIFLPPGGSAPKTR